MSKDRNKARWSVMAECDGCGKWFILKLVGLEFSSKVCVGVRCVRCGGLRVYNVKDVSGAKA